jgi:hypothetical protein
VSEEFKGLRDAWLRNGLSVVSLIVGDGENLHFIDGLLKGVST